ncbi:hypothetical protein FACS1894186_1320 [Alphaproteobacteria bacterium]|nr:hypothetical protein FACS1894186_1320 [Alphaproteobacteria bacterium]
MSAENRLDGARIFAAKIAQLRGKIPRGLPLAHKGLDALECFDFSRVPRSYCCGDLTLENIIVAGDGRLYLIDFLDSFYDSWQLDAAKLLQDLELKWSWRRGQVSGNLAMRLEAGRSLLLGGLAARPDGAETIRTVYYLLLLTCLRIYPYARDDATMAWLDGAVGKAMAAIDGVAVSRLDYTNKTKDLEVGDGYFADTVRG